MIMISITRLRRKFEGYNRLVEAFENMVDKHTDHEHYFIPEFYKKEDIVYRMNSKLHFFCFDCKIAQEFTDFATKRFREIQEAYERIKQERQL